MYRETNTITGRKQPPVLPECNDSHEDFAVRFRVHFSEKIMNVHSTMYHRNAPVLPIENNHHHHCKLSTFTHTTAPAIVRLVSKCPSKSCAPDPWPTTLLKTNINSIAPVLANIINMSLPAEMHALVTPSLKKTRLDPNQELPPYIKCQLFRETCRVDLRRYIDENKLLDPFQSAYHPHHSTRVYLR